MGVKRLTPHASASGCWHAHAASAAALPRCHSADGSSAACGWCRRCLCRCSSWLCRCRMEKEENSLSRQTKATIPLRSIFGQACGSSSMGWPSVQSHTHWSALSAFFHSGQTTDAAAANASVRCSNCAGRLCDLSSRRSDCCWPEPKAPSAAGPSAAPIGLAERACHLALRLQSRDGDERNVLATALHRPAGDQTQRALVLVHFNYFFSSFLSALQSRSVSTRRRRRVALRERGNGDNTWTRRDWRTAQPEGNAAGPNRSAKMKWFCSQRKNAHLLFFFFLFHSFFILFLFFLFQAAGMLRRALATTPPGRQTGQCASFS
jgi:hypothetical protein